MTNVSCCSGGKIIFFGNGGSASDSQHLCAEFVGRYKKDRSPLPAISLNTDTSILTAVANDMGYEKVFERQVEALAKKEDIIFAISTSGSSKNVINAIKVAKKMNIKTIKQRTKMKKIENYKYSNFCRRW